MIFAKEIIVRPPGGEGGEEAAWAVTSLKEINGDVPLDGVACIFMTIVGLHFQKSY